MNIIHSIYDEFRERRAELEVPVADVKKCLSAFDTILLYGAGSSGIAFLDFLRRQGVEPDLFRC